VFYYLKRLNLYTQPTLHDRVFLVYLGLA